MSHAYVDFLCGQYSESDKARERRIERGGEAWAPSTALFFLRRLASEPRAWVERAACRGADLSWFYADQAHDSQQYAQARALCASCSVTEECEAYGRKFGQGFGLWGGKTPRELKQRKKAAR